ncbi:hypothetical protein GOODEAATRI_003576, partial [Goodea atripinnis]
NQSSALIQVMKSLPVCHNAVTSALPVSGGCVAQELVLAGVQRNQQINHKVGIVDGLAKHSVFLVLDQLLLFLLAQTWPQAQLLCRQVHGCLFLICSCSRLGVHILQRYK